MPATAPPSTRPPRTPTPDERAAPGRAFVDAAGGLETAGYCRTDHGRGAFANSAGQPVAGERRRGGAGRHRPRASGADGVARLGAGRLADLDGAVLGARAAAKARAGVDPVELPPGRYEVVLEPTAVADMLAGVRMYGFNGKAVRRAAVVRRASASPSSTRRCTLVDDRAGRRAAVRHRGHAAAAPRARRRRAPRSR